MRNCQVVYPLRIVRPIGKFKVDNKEQFNDFIADIIQNGGRIKEYIADNLKRATGKECLNHAAGYPCEYCESKGVRYVNKDGNKTSSHIVWPSSTSKGVPRTKESVFNIATEIESRGKLPQDEAKGVVGMSPLFQIENFDIVRDVPTEYMHSMCLGVTKSLVKLTFNVGESWPRNTKRKLTNPAIFNKKMLLIKVFREFSRRNRSLDFSVMKAQEFRNLACFFFTVIVDCIEEKAKERKLWLLLAYVMRSCILPNNEFKVIKVELINDLLQQFYDLYNNLFGDRNCTYNTHIVGSHLMEMRFHGPLTLTSAFGFESFYSELRRSYTAGTQSTLKQCLSKILLKRNISYHCCENSIYFSKTETNMENNTIVYKFIDLTHKMFKIIDIQGDNLICHRQGRYKHTFPELNEVNWSHVGVYEKGPISNEIVTIPKLEVHGKVMQVENLLITCPNNILREK